MLRDREPREIGFALGLSEYVILRAAAGARVLRASGAAITAGLSALDRETGDDA
jgi:hypothetical protein